MSGEYVSAQNLQVVRLCHKQEALCFLVKLPNLGEYIFWGEEDSLQLVILV